MSNRLQDKVVVITGSTKGIGKGIAMKCAEEGAKVVVSGRNQEAGNALVEEIERNYGKEAIFIQKDISSELGCKELMKESVAHFGRIDGLVNNAGIFPRGTILDTTEELFDKIFDVNIKGAFFCSKYAIREMLKIGKGAIVQIGSTNGYLGGENLVAYSCAKGAMLTLNKHIAAHYAKKQIRSNWITVGWVASEGEIELHESMGVDQEKLVSWAESSIPSGKMQTAEDMAYGVVYLLSDESNQVTGTELHINGGLGLKSSI
ncbi:SDR family NAD(P)-dependent oxidoreductase [Lederbergia ruris]|uniref:SDR family NAD(P)-dependent oxidoreductase n=1 Tax=Lederbergia ruris TaxID=217495 RepID=UPI00399F992D